MSSVNALVEQFYTSFQTNKSIDTNLVPINVENSNSNSNTNMYFGLLNLNTVSCSITNIVQEFVFVIDHSGSMLDMCKDGHTKLQHIQHTLTNIVNYLCDNVNGLKIYITIFIFDDEFETAVKRVLVTKDNVQYIIKNIKNIKANGSTDIEKALTNVSDYIYDLSNDYPEHFINHIFMTDGQVTSGSTDHKILKTHIAGTSYDPIGKVCYSAFVGFGIDHDSILLNSLADDKNCSYYFIDAIEHAGLVYGEILHSILYKLMADVEITIENGFIYDYKNNKWVKKLSVGQFTSEVNKIFHLASSEPLDCNAILTCSNISDSGARSHLLLDLEADHTKYIYRQRTLQLLAEVKSYQESNYFKENNRTSQVTEHNRRSQLKKKLKLFYEELKLYMNENALQEDKIMKNLCDDIYISYKTFGTKYGAMYSCARQTSQGTQRFYSATKTPDDIDLNATISNQDLGFDYGFGYTPRFGNRRFGNRRAGLVDDDMVIPDEEEDDIIDHEVSGFIDTPYSSQTATFIMNTVSGHLDLAEDDDTIIN